MSQTETYTIRPTFEGQTDDDVVWTVPADSDLEARVVSWCRANAMDGAHVFTGSAGPIYGETGHEDNYCGWIDAR